MQVLRKLRLSDCLVMLVAATFGLAGSRAILNAEQAWGRIDDHLYFGLMPSVRMRLWISGATNAFTWLMIALTLGLLVIRLRSPSDTPGRVARCSELAPIAAVLFTLVMNGVVLVIECGLSSSLHYTFGRQLIVRSAREAGIMVAAAWFAKLVITPNVRSRGRVAQWSYLIDLSWVALAVVANIDTKIWVQAWIFVLNLIEALHIP